MADKRSSLMARTAYLALEEKKAEDIKLIDIEKVSVIADYFLIASGTNRAQMQALSENVEEQMEKNGFEIRQKEGYQSANWILLDYGDIIIHLFDRENRLFYDLERIWRDGESITLSDLPSEE